MGHRNCKHSVILLMPISVTRQLFPWESIIKCSWTGVNIFYCTSSIWNFPSASISTSLIQYIFFWCEILRKHLFFQKPTYKVQNNGKPKENRKKNLKSLREQHLEKQHHWNIQQIYVQCAKIWQGAWLRNSHIKGLFTWTSTGCIYSQIKYSDM